MSAVTEQTVHEELGGRPLFEGSPEINVEVAPPEGRRTFSSADVGDLESGSLIVHCTSRDRCVTVLQTTARDANLSFKARGILVYLMSLPSNWKTWTALELLFPDIGEWGRN